TGMLNKIEFGQRKIAMEKQLTEIQMFTSVLGKSRKQIMDSMSESMKDPGVQNLMHMMEERLGGQAAANFAKNFQHIIGNIEGQVQDETAKKTLTDLMTVIA